MQKLIDPHLRDYYNSNPKLLLLNPMQIPAPLFEVKHEEDSFLLHTKIEPCDQLTQNSLSEGQETLNTTLIPQDSLMNKRNLLLASAFNEMVKEGPHLNKFARRAQLNAVLLEPYKLGLKTCTQSKNKSVSVREISLMNDATKNKEANFHIENAKNTKQETEGSVERKDEDQDKDELPNSPYKPPIWTKEKDAILLRLGAEMKGEWKRIARKFCNKLVTPRFVKNRYQELTFAPKQRRTKFHPTEDLMLAKYFEIYGSNWTQMAVHFPNRTPVMLKNRYYAFIKKNNMLDFLAERAKELETTENNGLNFKNQPSHQIPLNPRVTAPTSFSCKEEIDSTSEVKEESKNRAENPEILTLQHQVHLFRTMYYQTKLELDYCKAKMQSLGIPN